jgi:2,5-dioxopentanoate dehydrogenase
MDAAASLAEPIPFYAEISSTNPVFILPGAMRQGVETIAAGLHAPFTMGAGQFCTKPGMIFLPPGSEAAAFAQKVQQLVAGSAPFHLLTKTIHSSYDSAIAARKTDSSVRLVAEGEPPGAEAGFAVTPALLKRMRRHFSNPSWTRRSFGSTTLLVHTPAGSKFSPLPARSMAA